MSYNKPMSQRKAASTFICDSTNSNLIRFSPRKKTCRVERIEQSVPYAADQDSRTTFIGESILSTDRPRAFAVTKTGEKQLLELEDNPIQNSSTNPFTLNTPRYSTPVMERISEKSSSQSITDKFNKSNSKLLKKPKVQVKRFASQKQRLLFSPRHIDINSSTSSPAPAKEKNYSKIPNPKYMEVSRNHSTETQTEYNTSLLSSSYIPKQYNKGTATSASINYIPMEGPRNYVKESTQRQQRQYKSSAPPHLKPLKVYTKSNYNLRKYSELRSLASALTLITVISWLFSTFFDVECLWDYLDSMLQYFQNLFFTKEKPKTKVEVFITFLQDLWS